MKIFRKLSKKSRITHPDLSKSENDLVKLHNELIRKTQQRKIITGEEVFGIKQEIKELLYDKIKYDLISYILTRITKNGNKCHSFICSQKAFSINQWKIEVYPELNKLEVYSDSTGYIQTYYGYKKSIG